MAPRRKMTKSITFRVESVVADAMEDVQRRFGTPISEQARRALSAWLLKIGSLKEEL